MVRCLDANSAKLSKYLIARADQGGTAIDLIHDLEDPLGFVRRGETLSHHTPAIGLAQFLPKNLLISANGTRSASPAKLPSDRKVVAARMKPVQAANASAPSTLMRRTPSAAISPTFTPMSLTTSRLSGFGATASTSVLISAGLCAPGAKSTSAPAAAYACRRRTDSWRGSG